jgi:hypothetical protein
VWVVDDHIGYIDLAACFLDVGSSYPGGAHNFERIDAEVRTTSKGGAVRPLKGNVSWVQTVVSWMKDCKGFTNSEFEVNFQERRVNQVNKLK